MIELYKLMVGVNKGVLQLLSQGYIRQKKIVNRFFRCNILLPAIIYVYVLGYSCVSIAKYVFMFHTCNYVNNDFAWKKYSLHYL